MFQPESNLSIRQFVRTAGFVLKRDFQEGLTVAEQYAEAQVAICSTLIGSSQLLIWLFSGQAKEANKGQAYMLRWPKLFPPGLLSFSTFLFITCF